MKLIVDNENQVGLEAFSSDACSYLLFPHNKKTLVRLSLAIYFCAFFFPLRASHCDQLKTWKFTQTHTHVHTWLLCRVAGCLLVLVLEINWDVCLAKVDDNPEAISQNKDNKLINLLRAPWLQAMCVTIKARECHAGSELPFNHLSPFFFFF